MPIIDVNSISFSYSSQPLLDGVSLRVGDGERACLVGPNGSGKTTLLRIVSGDIMPDRGSVTVGGATGAMRVPTVVGASGSVQDYLDEVLTDVRGLVARFDDVTKQLADNPESQGLSDEYDALLEQLTASDAWSLDARIDETLAGLGMPQLADGGRQRPVRTLSPGQAGRLELAALILIQPGVLIMDEPTNHLDDNAVKYLIEQVRQWHGPVLMASHDRAFIEEVATVIYDLDISAWQALVTADGGEIIPGVYRCAGRYSHYLVAKHQAQAEHHRIHAEQQHMKRNIELHRRDSEDIARGGVRLTTAQGKARKYFADRAAKTSVRRTRNDDQRLDDLVQKEVRKPRSYELSVALPTVRSRAGLAVTIRSATVPGRLRPVTLDLAHGEHLLLTGPNGVGKTTLLEWIVTGRPPSTPGTPASGDVGCAGRLAYLPQHLPRVGDPGVTPELWDAGIGDAGSGILHPAMWNRPIRELSAGNQRRAQIALAIAAKPEILVIDEPTNYLDLATIEALESALTEWSGTLLVATHDRWLIDHWQGRRLDLGG